MVHSSYNCVLPALHFVTSVEGVSYLNVAAKNVLQGASDRYSAVSRSLSNTQLLTNWVNVVRFHGPRIVWTIRTICDVAIEVVIELMKYNQTNGISCYGLSVAGGVGEVTKVYSDSVSAKSFLGLSVRRYLS